MTTVSPSDPDSSAEPVTPERAQPDVRERATGPVELLWDLVFAFAVTQVITLQSRHLTWGGFGRAMLVLALVWWAWSAFVWVVNAFDDEERLLRIAMLVALLFIFLAGLALPRAFENEAPLFACTYAVVRLIHLALYAEASRRGNAAWSSIMGFAVTVVIGVVLLIVGSLLGSGPRTALWVLSAASKLDAHVLVVFVLCLLTTIGLWWTYFDELADAAQERLRREDDPVLAAVDGYSYVHLLLVAGIVIFAVGTKLAIRGSAPGQLALCGGVAVYLLGQAIFWWRMLGRLERSRTAAAILLFALCPFAHELAPWLAAAIVASVLGVLCANEARRASTRLDSTE